MGGCPCSHSLISPRGTWLVDGSGDQSCFPSRLLATPLIFNLVLTVVDNHYIRTNVSALLLMRSARTA